MKLNYRFLSPEDFLELHKTLLLAYSDYLISSQPSEDQFKNHIAQNAIDLNQSVGVFDENKMIAFTLNGFGFWNGKQTAYDAGTGVIPQYRNIGIGKQMFDFMIPALKKSGVEQILLEVITRNDKAVALYRKLGFEETRNLISCDRNKNYTLNTKAENDTEIREIKDLDWNILKTFWDGIPSWQYSAEAMGRSSIKKLILGAFLNKKFVGYGIVSPKRGFISQIAVDRNHRRKGIASNILAAMEMKIEKDEHLHITNVDSNLAGVAAFLQNTGFYETLRQFEMIKIL